MSPPWTNTTLARYLVLLLLIPYVIILYVIREVVFADKIRSYAVEGSLLSQLSTEVYSDP